MAKLLAPSSDLHKAKDWRRLAEAARVVEQLATDLPEGHVVRWREDLELAVRLMIPPCKDMIRPKRPELNTSDL